MKDISLKDISQFPGFDELRRRAELSGNALITHAERAEQTDVDRILHLDGGTYDAPVIIVLIQAINHGVDHRSQIVTLLTQQGITPPDLDGWSYNDAMRYRKFQNQQQGNMLVRAHERERIMRPTIVLLIGTSSAGKSTLAKRLQEALPEPYLLLGIDDVFRMVPERWGGGLEGPLSAVGFRYDRTSEQGVVTIRYGAVGGAILKGMHRAVAAFAEAGNNLIIDEMLLDERVLIDWIEQLGRFQPYLVQVTATEAMLERRERERQHGGTLGLARGHLRVNDLRHRDLLIDTTDQQLDVYAQALSHWLRTQPPATAVGEYRKDYGLL